MNTAFLAGSAYIIIMTNVEAPSLKVWMAGVMDDLGVDEKYAQFADLAPTLVVSAANGLVNPFARFTSDFERWDYKHMQVNSEIVKIWIGKSVNLLIMVSI